MRLSTKSRLLHEIRWARPSRESGSRTSKRGSGIKKCRWQSRKRRRHSSYGASQIPMPTSNSTRASSQRRNEQWPRREPPTSTRCMQTWTRPVAQTRYTALPPPATRHRATQDIGQIKCIKDSNHVTLRGTPAIRQRWSDYFGEISNGEFPHPPIASADPVPGPVSSITVEEVEVAIKAMKNGKAIEPDDIPAEVWKLFGHQGALVLRDLFNRITTDSKAPQSRLTSTTAPIWEGKGDVAECSNYRPIRLLCHTMKIFE